MLEWRRFETIVVYGLACALGTAAMMGVEVDGAWAAGGGSPIGLSQNVSGSDRVPEGATADGPVSGDLPPLAQELADGFYWRVNILSYGILRDPETRSVLNEDNRLDINRYQAEVDVRPDFALTFRRLELGFKPRFEYKWSKWSEGEKDGDTDTDTDLFVNEWLVRLKLTDEFFASYGRENLQWGPSQLISPSNPFNKNNDKNNPKREVDGLDYARVVWVPSYNWSVSAIANTDEGRADFLREWEPKYALKIDYTGNKKYASVIPSFTDGDESDEDEWNLGFFGGWSVSDALLVYAEGNVFIESVEPRIDDGDVNFLVGSSYTTTFGPTLYIEYYRNEGGCTDRIELCWPPVGNVNLDNNGLTRKDYTLVQIVDNDRWDVLDTIVRWIWDLNDGSNRFIGIFEYEINDYVQLFAIGDLFTGDVDSEFGSVLDGSLFFGFEITF